MPSTSLRASNSPTRSFPGSAPTSGAVRRGASKLQPGAQIPAPVAHPRSGGGPRACDRRDCRGVLALSPPEATSSLTAAVGIDHSVKLHPLSITVTANGSDGTPPYEYARTFGDGGTVFGDGAAHVYATRRSCQVPLRATDPTNGTAEAGVTVKVTPLEEAPTLPNSSAQVLGFGESRALTVPLSTRATAVSPRVDGAGNLTR
jgi:hypothetical protein